MPLTLEELWTYQPPTEAQKPLYAAIRAAEKQCAAAIYTALFCSDGVRSMDERYAAVKRGTLGLALVIEEIAPASADRTVAIRALRLVRMEANEILQGPLLTDPTGCIEASDRWRNIIEPAIRHARFWACSAIALDGQS